MSVAESLHEGESKFKQRPTTHSDQDKCTIYLKQPGIGDSVRLYNHYTKYMLRCLVHIESLE
jgi:hypothetical protein